MKSDNAIRNGTSIFVGIIVAIAAFVRGALLLPLLLVACSVWGLYMLHHLRGGLPAVPKKKAKTSRRAKFVVSDIGDEPLSDILLLHVNQRITAALRTAGSNIAWEWATKDPLAIVKEGWRCLLRVHGLDGFESAEVVMDKQAHLRCELINTVPLRPTPTADAPEKPRIPAETPPRASLDDRAGGRSHPACGRQHIGASETALFPTCGVLGKVETGLCRRWVGRRGNFRQAGSLVVRRVRV